MKKILTIAIILMGMATMLMTACNSTGKQNEKPEGGDTTKVNMEDTKSNAQAERVFTAEGISPILLGTPIKDIPEQVEGLYASKSLLTFDNENPEEGDPNDVNGWYFFDVDGNKLFSVEEDDKGKVARIIIRTPSIKTAEGVRLGMLSKEVAAIKGIEKVPFSPDADQDYVHDIYRLNGVDIEMDWDNKAVALMSVERW